MNTKQSSLASLKSSLMQLIWLLKLGLVILLALTSCRGQVNLPTITKDDNPIRQVDTNIAQSSPTPLSTNEQGLGWFKDSSCQLPCLANLMPGKTTYAEALRIIQTNSEAKLLRVSEPHPVSNWAVITWQWDKVSEKIDLRFVGNTITATLDAIRLTLMQTMTTEELINVIGEPSHVVVDAGDSSPGRPNLYSLSYVYLNHGVAVDFGATLAPTKPIVSRDRQFKTLELYEPSKQGYRNATGMAMETLDQLLIKWQGFRDFDFYCPQAYPKEPDRCKQ